MEASKAIETFRCDRQAMTLTRGGCARLWESLKDKPPQPFEGRWQCRACPIGAAHAGVAEPQAEADTAATEIALEGLCPRCERKGNRLIGGHLCVSCYNRAREIVRGKNRKGNPPKVVQARLAPLTLIVADPEAAHTSRATIFASVTGGAEAMLTAAKAAHGGSLIFARAKAPVLQPAA